MTGTASGNEAHSLKYGSDEWGPSFKSFHISELPLVLLNVVFSDFMTRAESINFSGCVISIIVWLACFT